MKKLMYILVLLMVFCACIKQIDIEYANSKSLLVLNSVLKPGEMVKATLSSTQPFETIKLSPYHNDGKIILEENGQVVDTLQICERQYRQSQGDTIYIYCSPYPVKTGNTYSLRASRPGYPTVSASTIVPAKAKILEIHSVDNGEFDQPYDILIEDAGPEANFYLLQVISDDGVSDLQFASLTTADPVVSLFESTGLLSVPTDERTGSTAFFTDQYFNGKVKKLGFKVFFEFGFEATGVVLYSASREYYEYVRTLEINKVSGENIFSEPLRVKSNVVNGFGLVGAVNVTEVKF